MKSDFRGAERGTLTQEGERSSPVVSSLLRGGERKEKEADVEENSDFSQTEEKHHFWGSSFQVLASFRCSRMAGMYGCFKGRR